MFWRCCHCCRPSPRDQEGGDSTGKILDYNHSGLEDVPNEVFHKERTLEELCLDSNQIKDLPRQLFHCSGLRKLNLSDNEIQSLPSAISSLVNLEELNLSKNGVLEMPESIRLCTRIRSLDMSINPLGRLSDGFTQLINLQELYLNDTFLEYLPANFGRLTQLKVLEVRENHLKMLPKSISRLTELRRLDIGQNDLLELPEVIGSLTQLSELWVDFNRLISIPACIGNLKNLTYLDASNNRIEDVAEELGCCVQLTDLSLALNKITYMPDSVCELSRLVALRLEENELSLLPDKIGNLGILEELHINNNFIEFVPSSIGFIRNLQTFIADSNKIRELPASIGSCTKLRLLSLSDNQISYLPDEIGRLSSLKVLNLSGNHLQNLPFSLMKISQLQALWLSSNQQKPIMKLQSDVDNKGCKVLTCYMLPQQQLSEPLDTLIVANEEEETRSPSVEGKQAIKFVDDDGENISGDDEASAGKGLLRNPTPYPKELKAHARHARNLALTKKDVADKPDVVDNHDGGNGDFVYPAAADDSSSSRYKVKEAVVKVQPAAREDANFATDHVNGNGDTSRHLHGKENVRNDQNKFSGFLGRGSTNPDPHVIYANDGNLYFTQNNGNSPQLDRSFKDQSMMVHIGDYSMSDSMVQQAEPFVYSKSPQVVRLTKSILESENGDDCLKDGVSLSSVTSLYASSGSDRVKSRNSPFASTYTANMIVTDTNVLGGNYVPQNNGPLTFNPANIARCETFEQPSRQSPAFNGRLHSLPPHLIIQKFSQDTHTFQPRIPMNGDSYIGSRQHDSAFERAGENISDDSSQSSSASMIAQTTHLRNRINTHTFPVIIVKNPDIGFSVEGGLDKLQQNSKNGDSSIFVSSVTENGPASTSLKRGDKILRVDDIDLYNVTTDTAKAILSSTGSTVNLLVTRSAS